MELFCSRDLALLLGAVEPESIAHHRELKHTGLLVRDIDTSRPLFWPWTLSRLDRLTIMAWPTPKSS
jgi:hypothetical protein